MAGMRIVLMKYAQIQFYHFILLRIIVPVHYILVINSTKVVNQIIFSFKLCLLYYISMQIILFIIFYFASTGLHYKSPYPRPVHMPPNTITMRDGKAWGQGNLRRQKTSRPIYVKSLDDET